ncbi:MAG: SDR family NAD(P)-dependent oxidoreductase [Acidimicrobiia bacterium]|jgi:NAD(P)-dependent dehydrogenase (short-subunit alcohol dehydrogenase family)
MAVALITGASRGFGRALARSLALDGWSLVLDARGAFALEVVTSELAELTEVRAVAGSIADPAHRERLVAEAETLGGLDLLVNNASELGPSPLRALAGSPLDVLRSVYEVNVFAPLALVQSALTLLRASHGTIVNITSDAAREPYEGWGAYGSSKAALEQWGNVLGGEEPDVRVYTFDPGDMRTQMHQDAFPGEDISDRPEPEVVVPSLRRLLAEHPHSGRYTSGELVR